MIRNKKKTNLSQKLLDFGYLLIKVQSKMVNDRKHVFQRNCKSNEIVLRCYLLKFPEKQFKLVLNVVEAHVLDVPPFCKLQ